MYTGVHPCKCVYTVIHRCTRVHRLLHGSTRKTGGLVQNNEGATWHIECKWGSESNAWGSGRVRAGGERGMMVTIGCRAKSGPEDIWANCSRYMQDFGLKEKEWRGEVPLARTAQRDLFTKCCTASPPNIAPFSMGFDIAVQVSTSRLLSQDQRVDRHSLNPRMPWYLVRRDNGGFPDAPSSSSKIIGATMSMEYALKRRNSQGLCSSFHQFPSYDRA
ncbi:hypothetical protein ARMGADRAFT_1032134 [Armillaria gallica]|uniref:Uncharacterized protein n=1 Tax=Armillaria gallica TaxID=47427 RepID=A0A2H3D772_ARMGA|nr:hypothetical protein ARMGADRAFT_1032134 [Armillaria gallica]